MVNPILDHIPKHVLVTGGAGYVGSVLVPELVRQGYTVTVFDTFWFWDSPQEYLQATGLHNNPNVLIVHGDLRKKEDIKKALKGTDSVIHLACISNDPSSELDPSFTHEVNYDGSIQLIDLAKEAGIRRFIYASSSSVYGIKQEPNVTEDLPLEPLTQYSRLKVEVEHYLLYKLDEYGEYKLDGKFDEPHSGSFHGVIIRPSTVCGYSPRQRLDVVINILTNFAVNKGKIKVFGGDQLRPNIHIKDMVRAYLLLLQAPIQKINKKVYNAGYENLKVIEIAKLVQDVVGHVEMEVEETDDPRSYHVCSDKIKSELGFDTKHTVREAILELKEAFEKKLITSADDERWNNMKRMKTILSAMK